MDMGREPHRGICFGHDLNSETASGTGRLFSRENSKSSQDAEAVTPIEAANAKHTSKSAVNVKKPTNSSNKLDKADGKGRPANGINGTNGINTDTDIDVDIHKMKRGDRLRLIKALGPKAFGRGAAAVSAVSADAANGLGEETGEGNATAKLLGMGNDAHIGEAVVASAPSLNTVAMHNVHKITKIVKKEAEHAIQRIAKVRCCYRHPYRYRYYVTDRCSETIYHILTGKHHPRRTGAQDNPQYQCRRRSLSQLRPKAAQAGELDTAQCRFLPAEASRSGGRHGKEGASQGYALRLFS